MPQASLSMIAHGQSASQAMVQRTKLRSINAFGSICALLVPCEFQRAQFALQVIIFKMVKFCLKTKIKGAWSEI